MTSEDSNGSEQGDTTADDARKIAPRTRAEPLRQWFWEKSSADFYYITIAAEPFSPAIAQVWSDVDVDAQQAARLIAAAPDLLEACRWAAAALAPFSKSPAEKSGISMLRAAIAKALGEP